MAIAGLILGSVAALSSLITTAALITGVGANRTPDPAPTSVAIETKKPTATPPPSATPMPTATPTPTPTPVPTVEAPVAPPPPVVSVSQANAKRSAQDYLRFMPFSRTGLIDQLMYEGFSVEDATYGVDASGADWYAQAVLSAQAYLDMMGFSRSGLIDQLIYEGYTPDEATFGVDSVGL